MIENSALWSTSGMWAHQGMLKEAEKSNVGKKSWIDFGPVFGCFLTVVFGQNIGRG